MGGKREHRRPQGPQGVEDRREVDELLRERPGHGGDRAGRCDEHEANAQHDADPDGRERHAQRVAADAHRLGERAQRVAQDHRIGGVAGRGGPR